MTQRITKRLATSRKYIRAKGRRIFLDSEIQGFGIRFHARTNRGPDAIRSFILDFRHEDRQRRRRIGRYPEITVAEARRLARQMRTQRTKGFTPIQAAEGPSRSVRGLVADFYKGDQRRKRAADIITEGAR